MTKHRITSQNLYTCKESFP